MNTKVYKKEINLPDGRVISIETGKLAKQADGSAVIQMGNAMLLATCKRALSLTECGSVLYYIILLDLIYFSSC